jgi:hypothetical protein
MIDCQQIAATPSVWVTTLAALLTPVIAVAAAFIAWQQWRTNRNKLKLDLFDRRFAIYDAARTFIGQLLAGTHASDAQTFDFLSRTRDAEFILDKDIADYLFKQIYQRALTLTTLRSEMEGLPMGEERTNNVQRQREIREWFLQQHEALAQAFSKYLALEH